MTPPLVPGEDCPAIRARVWNSTVEVTHVTSRRRYGVGTCTRCGRERVGMNQGYGATMGAWYFDPHTIPTKEEM